MSQVALFTDENNRVILKHYQTDKLSQDRLAEAAVLMERSELPEMPQHDEDQKAVMYVQSGSPVYLIEAKSQ